MARESRDLLLAPRRKPSPPSSRTRDREPPCQAGPGAHISYSMGVRRARCAAGRCARFYGHHTHCAHLHRTSCASNARLLDKYLDPCQVGKWRSSVLFAAQHRAAYMDCCVVYMRLAPEQVRLGSPKGKEAAHVHWARAPHATMPRPSSPSSLPLSFSAARVPTHLRRPP